MEEHHIRRLEIVPYIQRVTKTTNQRENYHLEKREETHGREKVIEQKTEKNKS